MSTSDPMLCNLCGHDADYHNYPGTCRACPGRTCQEDQRFIAEAEYRASLTAIGCQAAVFVAAHIVASGGDSEQA